MPLLFSMAILLINKTPGMTSHDVVDVVRKKIGERKVGHAGTLDPFAEGLLIILTGTDTKRQSEFMKLPKVYEATFVLGEERDTDDITGKQRKTHAPGSYSTPPLAQVKEALASFVGDIEQMPPAYSAKKIKGKKAYELARKGVEPELKPARVHIYSIELLSYEYPELKIRTEVSKGTYIRALARDVGRALGTGAYVKELKRTQIGEYELGDAERLDEIKKE